MPTPGHFTHVHVFEELGLVAYGIGHWEGLELEAAPVRIRNHAFSGTVFMTQFQGKHKPGAVVSTVPHPVDQSLVIGMSGQAIRAGMKTVRHVEPVVRMREMVGR